MNEAIRDAERARFDLKNEIDTNKRELLLKIKSNNHTVSEVQEEAKKRTYALENKTLELSNTLSAKEIQISKLRAMADEQRQEIRKLKENIEERKNNLTELSNKISLAKTIAETAERESNLEKKTEKERLNEIMEKIRTVDEIRDALDEQTYALRNSNESTKEQFAKWDTLLTTINKRGDELKEEVDIQIQENWTKLEHTALRRSFWKQIEEFLPHRLRGLLYTLMMEGSIVLLVLIIRRLGLRNAQYYVAAHRLIPPADANMINETMTQMTSWWTAAIQKGEDIITIKVLRELIWTWIKELEWKILDWTLVIFSIWTTYKLIKFLWKPRELRFEHPLWTSPDAYAASNQLICEVYVKEQSFFYETRRIITTIIPYPCKIKGKITITRENAYVYCDGNNFYFDKPIETAMMLGGIALKRISIYEIPFHKFIPSRSSRRIACSKGVYFCNLKVKIDLDEDDDTSM